MSVEGVLTQAAYGNFFFVASFNRRLRKNLNSQSTCLDEEKMRKVRKLKMRNFEEEKNFPALSQLNSYKRKF